MLLFFVAACTDRSTTEPAAAEYVQIYTTAALIERISAATGLPTEALSASPEEIARRYDQPAGGVSRRATEAEVFSAIELVMARSPHFESLGQSDISRISGDFGGLTDVEVFANLDRIRQIYVAKIRYEVYQEAVARASSRAVGGPQYSLLSQWNELNDQEKALVKKYPHLALPTRQAKTEATQYADGYWGWRGDGHRGNAYKHSLWNALIAKHVGVWFNSIDGALNWAKTITDAHEYGWEMPNEPKHRDMDLHNNDVGRQYFRSVGWVQKTRRGLEVWAPSVSSIAEGLRSRAESAVKFSVSSELTSRRASLVYFITGSPVYRLYHPGIPDHLYTITAGEGTRAGWRPEGDRYFYLAPDVKEYQLSGYAPLYRCWVSGRHYVSLEEMCEANVRAEGVLGRVYTSQLAGTYPLYRLRHPTTRDVLTTWSGAERDQAIQRYGYQLQTITGYAWLKE